MQQTEQQTQEQRIRGKPWPKGLSANKSGRTVALAVHDSLLDAFRSTHNREPSVIEALNLRITSKLVAKSQSPRVDAEQATRCANTVSRLLTSLGLHTKRPAAGKPARSLTTIRDYIASKASPP